MTGYGTSLALLVMSGVVATIYLLLLKRENRKRDLGLRDERRFLADADNLGDDHPSFRFSF